jgi:predicted dehydrogenase
MDQVRVGVIGSGYWGPNLIRNFAEIPVAKVVAVADLKEARLANLRRTYPQIATTQDYHDLFQMNLDAVVVATPPATHHAIAKECLEHGLHVMVEKPITLKASDAEDLIRIAEQEQRWLMVGHTFIFNAAVEALKTMIDSGELGQIYYIDAARLNLGLFQRETNVLWDLAPHDIAVLLYLLGDDPVSLSAQGQSSVMDGVHDLVYMNMVFPKNVLAHVHVSWLDPCKIRRITVVGSKKMVVYNDVDATKKITIYDKGVDVPPYTNTFSEFQCSYRYGDITIPNIKSPEPLRVECQHFLDCILNHQKPKTSGEEGLRVVRILETAQQSLIQNGRQETVSAEAAPVGIYPGDY